MSSDKVSILLVDDKKSNLVALEAVLKNPEYNLVGVHSGEEALKKVLTMDFAVILLDVQMTGMNGIETAKLIKSREKSKDIPIIFITAIDKAIERVHLGYSVGAVDYIYKPFDPQILKYKVDTLVQLYKSRREIELQRNMLKEHTAALKMANLKLQCTADVLRKSEEEKKRYAETLEILVEKRTAELSSSEKRFRSMFELSPNLVSIRSCRDGSYLDVNKSWQEYTGYHLAEIKSQPVKIFFPYDQDECWDTVVKNLKVKYYPKKGKKRHGLLSTSYIEIEGEKCQACVVTDITERVLMEKEIYRLDRLNLIGEMAAGIAHEIRNPMTTVHGFLQTLNGKVLSPEYVELMLDELNRANAIISEVLTLAKNKRSDFVLQDINLITKHVSPLINAEAFRQDKTVVFEPAECPPFKFDEKEMRQLILNLALNGFEAMSPGGELRIKTYRDNEEIVLQVTDQGGGISEKIFDQIGTPFFTTKDEGTGLGLAVCYSIAARHKAKIYFETDHRGTSFFVRFPLDQNTLSCLTEA